MTVLKAHAANGVRMFSTPFADTPKPVESGSPVDPRIGELTAALAASEAALAAYREEAAAEIVEARVEGAAAVRAEDERRFALLEEGVADAVEAWRDRLDGLERLAAVVADAALAKLFDDHADLSDWVGRTLAKRITAIGAGSAVRVRVSARDFPDRDTLAALAMRAGLPSEAVVAEPDAPTGACEIDLAVGHLDLSIAGQWHAIERALADIASGALA